MTMLLYVLESSIVFHLMMLLFSTFLCKTSNFLFYDQRSDLAYLDLFWGSEINYQTNSPSVPKIWNVLPPWDGD